MLRTVAKGAKAEEGYVYVSYGHPKYLEHVIASVVTLRRYDTERPIALVCTEKHQEILQKNNLDNLFTHISILPNEHASIVGFKHNVHEYMFFNKNLYLDSDIVWCKNPDTLWQAFAPYDFTITGNLTSDSFFGSAKSVGVLKDVILGKRKKTLKRFGLTYLSRVQSGVMYAKDHELTKKICELAGEMLDRKHETHFKSRKMEAGRTMESCEWSLAMAMSKLNIPIYPWLKGHNSPQLDFISDLTDHDDDFQYVKCTYYCDDFMYSFRGLKSNRIRRGLIKFYSIFPGKGDFLLTTPYCLHFGWFHEKQPFYDFSDRVWESLLDQSESKNSLNVDLKSLRQSS